MKQIKKGKITSRPIPWYVGARVKCNKCNAVVEFDKEDMPQTKVVNSFFRTYISSSCPTEGCNAIIFCLDTRNIVG